MMGETTPEWQSEHDRVLQTLQRDVNILNDSASDRLSKRRALEKLNSLFSLNLEPQVHSMLFKSVSKPLLRCLADPVEKVRELSIGLVSSWTSRVADVFAFLSYMLPAIKDRLGGAELIEPSEEIRLDLIKALSAMVQAAGPAYAPFVDDTVAILSRVLLDTFPEVKKESIKLLMVVCATSPRPLAHHSGLLAKAILPSLVHRHSSVRTIAIQGLCEIVLVDAAGLDDSLEPLWGLTNDAAPAVREALYTLSRDWLTKLVDRYTFGYKVLPLLLAGFSDPVPKLSALSKTYMDEAGVLYEKEWESRVKDEMDYTDGAEVPDRPRVGCRHLARDNTQKVISKLVESMADWSADARYRACRILKTFLIFTEDQITGYTHLILAPLIKIMAGDDAHVMQEALEVCEVFGRFVHPDTSMSFLIPQIGLGGGTAIQFRIGCLRVMERLLKGTSPEKAQFIADRVIKVLSEYDMIYHENHVMLYEIAKCVHHLTDKLDLTDSKNVAVAYRLFFVLLVISSIPGDLKVDAFVDCGKEVQTALDSFVKASHLNSRQDAYVLHLDHLLNDLDQNKQSWTRHSYDLRVLKNALMSTKEAIGPFEGKMLYLLAFGSEPVRDLEVRERYSEMTLVP